MNKLKDKLKKLKKEVSNLSSSTSNGRFVGTGHKLGTAEPKPDPRPRPPAPAAVTATRSSTPISAPVEQPRPQTHVAPQRPQPPQVHVEASEEVVTAVSLLQSSPEASAAADILYRILRNIISSPNEEKFRRIRLSNPKIQSAVVDTDGGVELLLACGFQIEFPNEEGAAVATEGSGEDSSAGDGFAVLPNEADLLSLQGALPLLAVLLPQPPAQPLASPVKAVRPQPQRQWDAPRDRQTKVVLPVSVDTDVPSWFFERTGLELKSFFAASAKKREQEQMLMTKAMRDRLAIQNKLPEPTHAVVKVRLPEGISFQGEFNGGEPVVSVFAWVADCLRDPLQTYDLIQPDRKPLQMAELSVKQAGLMPAVTLNLRWTGQSAVAMKEQPALRNELLRSA